jgi:hypothetical protein
MVFTGEFGYKGDLIIKIKYSKGYILILALQLLVDEVLDFENELIL